MNEHQAAVEVIDLEKTYRIGFFRKKVPALCKVSFKVNQGEIFGLLGPNGAGKTTTIKMLMGLVSPDSGSFSIMGKTGTGHMLREKVGYLPENPYFHEYLTPIELLEFYGRMCGVLKSKIKENRDRLIELVGLTDAANRPLRKFSKGMLQRIGLAQALISDPELLVLDEPMSGLDPIGRRFVADLIGDLNSRGTTIVFSSHILSDVERLCDRVVILKKGLMVAQGRIDDLVDSDDKEKDFESLFIRKALE